MKILKNKAGVVLAESLMAVAMLSIAGVILAKIINNAAVATISSKNYLVAQNLATEAIEAVKHVRDSNWLIEPDDKDCWLRMDPFSGDECGDTSLPLFGDTGNPDADGKHYLVEEKAEGKWTVESGPTASLKLTGLEDSDGPYQDYRLYQLNDQYVTKFLGEADGDESPFYRSLEFLKFESDAGISSRALVRAKVQWTEGIQVKTVFRSFVLYNHL